MHAKQTSMDINKIIQLTIYILSDVVCSGNVVKLIVSFIRLLFKLRTIHFAVKNIQKPDKKKKSFAWLQRSLLCLSRVQQRKKNFSDLEM